MGTPFSRLASFAVLALLVGLGGACRSLVSDDEDLERWGLPGDLPVRQRQLHTLQLPPEVDSIDWLADGLEVLLIAQTNVSDLRGLPATLKTLDVSFSQVTSLRGLPPGLRELNLESAPVQSPLIHLPAGLETLTLSGDRLTSASGLPQGLTELRLVDAAALSIVSGLPGGLWRLSLAGPSFERIDALPPKLQVLALRGTSVKTLHGLPESLQSLVLQGNEQLVLDELPPFLTHLRTDRPAKPLNRLLYLERLEGPQVAFGQDALWPKPLTVLHLEVHAADDVPPLPASLRALAFLQSRTLPALPTPLENLSLERFQGSELPETSRSVRHLKQLSLALSKIRSIEHVPPTVVDLDLSATPITSLAELPAGLVTLRFRLSALSRIGNELSHLTRLQHLDLAGSPMLSSIADLPPSLVSLNVSGCPLAKLPKLPDSLLTLDISGTEIRGELPDLPPKLESLTLSRGQIESLSRLRRSVRRLYFI